MQDAREQPIWCSPTGYFLYASILLLCITFILFVWKVKQRQAERSFDQFVARTDALPDPREALNQYENYVKTHRDNELTRRARQKAKDAQQRVAKYEFDQTLNTATQTGADYESAMQIWQAYLDNQPGQPYRAQAEEQLRQLPDRIDDREFDRVDRQYPLNGPSLESRKTALEDYLARYPQGRHADAARKAIAQIPDALDQRMCEAIAAEVTGLVAAGKIVEAIDCLDAKSGAITSQARKERLLRTRETLTAELERLDLQKILSARQGDASQPRSVLSACRLFLLCYPASKQGPEVRKRMAAAVESLAIAEWQSVQQTVDANSAKPDVCLRALDRYLQRWPDALSVDRIRQAAHLCYAKILLGCLASASVPQTGTITKKDGTQVTGIIEEQKEVYKVVDPATGKRLPSVWKVDVQTYALSEASQAWLNLRKQLVALDPQNPDRAVLRAAAAQAKQCEIKNVTWMLCSLLARIDGDDPQSQQILERCGFWRVGKRWLSQDDAADTTILTRLVDHFTPSVVESVKQTMQQLPLTVKFTRLGVDEKVPVDCKVSLAGTDTQSVQRETSGLKAAVRFRFNIALQPQTAADSQSLNQLVEQIASKTQCEAILEVTEEHQTRTGVGIIPALHAGAWVASEVDPKGPAFNMWVEPGDSILAVNGQTLDEQKSQQEVTDMLAGTAGDVELSLKRNGRKFTLKISKSEWTESVYQARYYIRHNLNSTGAMQFLPQTSLPPASDI
jgi:hypothetical protein